MTEAPKQPEKKPAMLKALKDMTWEEKMQEQADWSLIFYRMKYDRWRIALDMDSYRNPGDYIR